MVIDAALGAVMMTSMYPPVGTLPALSERTVLVPLFVEYIGVVLVLATRVLESVPEEVVVLTLMVIG
jgi:hypothetical protein